MNLKITKVIAAFLTLHLTLEVSGFAIGGPFKCGELDCPNGSTCQITQKPNDDCKSVTIHTLCKTAAGELLKEETITKDLPEGKIPYTSFIQKTVSGHGYGAYSKDIPHSDHITYSTDDSNSDIEPSIHFVSLDESKDPETQETELIDSELIDSDLLQDMPFNFGYMGSLFDRMWSVPRGFLQCTNSFFDEVFNNFFFS